MILSKEVRLNLQLSMQIHKFVMQVTLLVLLIILKTIRSFLLHKEVLSVVKVG